MGRLDDCEYMGDLDGRREMASQSPGIRGSSLRRRGEVGSKKDLIERD